MAEFTPHPYQRRAFRHVTRRRRSALYLEMGLGKTVVALTAVQHWRNTLETHKTLVLGGKRVVRDVWPAEIEKWDHIDLTYSLVVGDAAARRQALKADADLYLMNYENLQWLDREKAWEFDTLILDESPALKKPGGKRRRALLRNLKPDYRMIQLTGTPSANGLQDLWGQVHLMDGGKRLGRTYGEYRDRHFFLVDKDTWRYKPREGAMEEITGKLADICLSMRSADYIELPPKIENVIETDLPPRVRAQYEELQEELILELKKGATITAPHTGALMNKLLQVCSGAVYDEAGDTHFMHDAKLDALASIIDEACGAPVLVAHTFVSERKRLLERFPQAEVISDGSVERWNRGEIPILLAHPKSAGEGLNLQHGGNIMVWFSLSWSLKDVLQFNARLHRQGQTKPVFIHYLSVPGSLDEYVFATVKRKGKLQDTLMERLL